MAALSEKPAPSKIFPPSIISILQEPFKDPKNSRLQWIGTLKLLSEKDPSGSALHNSICLQEYYGDTSLSALEGRCVYARAAFQFLPWKAEARKRVNILMNLSNCLRLRYTKHLEPKDLEDALFAARMATADFDMNATGLDPDLVWKPLTESYKEMYRKEHNRSILDEGATRARAFRAASRADSNSIYGLNRHLYMLLMKIYEDYYESSCLEECLSICEFMRDALENGKIPRDEWWKWERFNWLQSSAVCYDLKYAATHQQEDNENALTFATKAIEQPPSQSPNSLLVATNTRAAAVMRKHEYSHSLEDLNQAIRVLEETIEATTVMNGQYSAISINLISAYRYRYFRFKEVDDLDKAIVLCRRLLSFEHDDKICSEALLSANLFLRCRLTNDEGDWCECVWKAISVREKLSKVHRDRSGVACLLSPIWEYRANQTRKLEDVNDWVSLLEEALTCGQLSTDAEQGIFCDLGRAMTMRAILTDGDRTGAIKFWKDSVENETYRPMLRIHNAMNGAVYVPDQQSKYEMLKGAVRLLPKLSSHTLVQDDQQFILGQFSALASEACSAALQAGRSASEAIVLLEAARGSIASFLIKSKGRSADLEALHPQLYERYQKLLNTLAQLSNSSQAETFNQRRLTDDNGAQRARTIREIDEIEAEIRNCPQFSRFNMPPQPEELMALAVEGPLVSFNISYDRGDAIVVTQNAIRNIPLPGVTQEVLRSKVPSLSSEGNRARRHVEVFKGEGEEREPLRQDHQTSQTQRLLWLWEAVVKPVLGTLKLLQYDRRNGDLPCIWWVGGGSLSTVPLHAAGDHSGNSLENTISHVVSSYAPTLRTLQHVRKSSSSGSNSTSGVKCLLVAMPRTAGHPNLNVKSEIKAIENQVRKMPGATVFKGNGKADVMRKLSEATIAHFACHGMSDANNPLDGSLLLGDSEDDFLRVRDFKALNLHSAQIAYLSACSTAELLDLKLVEESVHLASMCQLVGFRHVIGTMWGAYDSAATQVADSFYRNLLSPSGVEDGSRGLTHRVRYALHDAICELRQTHRDPIHWAPFIHLGP